MPMEKLPGPIVAEAFALSRSRGADLLVRLGDFDVWRGDLSEMRGDSPRSLQTPADTSAAPTNTTFFFDTLIMARALELLQPVCRAALSALYLDHKDAQPLADDLDTWPEQAEKLIANCEKRLLEAYVALKAAGTNAPTPEWAVERELAAAASSGQRRR
jgi:hypothetical protein